MSRAPLPSPSPHSGLPIRIATYNIHQGFDSFGRLALERQAQAIEASRADVVGLQEVSRGWVMNGSVDTLDWLARRLRMHGAWGPTADPAWGNAVLSRFPIRNDLAQERETQGDHEWKKREADLLESGHLVPVGRREACLRIDNPEQPVRSARPLGCRRSRTQYFKTTINLHAVGINDDTIKDASQLDSEPGLAACGRSCDKKCFDISHILSTEPKALLMNNVATLIVKNQSPERMREGVASARQIIEEAGATVDRMDWLSPDEAVDLFFTGADPAEINPPLGTAMRRLQIDSYAHTHGSRRAFMLVADMDSTMIEIECIDELAAALGVKDQIAPITKAAMQGQTDFAPALQARVRLIAGLEVERMEHIRDSILSFSPGAKTLVATMRKAGAVTLLVSGGFTFFSDFVAKNLGFDQARANRLEIEKGRLTGRLTPPILTASSKRQALIEVRESLGISPDQTLAIGDGANDNLMLEEAGTGVAYHAKAKTAAAADARIDFAGLETALFYQGYRRSEFVTDETSCASQRPQSKDRS